jgi:hypothetical protein
MFYSWSDSGGHKPYGEIYTSLMQLANGETEYNLHQIDSQSTVPGATFEFRNLYIEERPSFFDFLNSGWEINLTVAIDFTASNGPVMYPDSLHYIDPRGNPNQYEAAITTVGSILENYDTDKLIPAFGFGGIPMYDQTETVNHCFHLNGAPQPECNRVAGLLEAYKFSLNNIKLYGPTFFGPCLQTFT